MSDLGPKYQRIDFTSTCELSLTYHVATSTETISCFLVPDFRPFGLMMEASHNNAGLEQMYQLLV